MIYTSAKKYEIPQKTLIKYVQHLCGKYKSLVIDVMKDLNNIDIMFIDC